MNKKRVTFADIAEYTHFSKTTISRYFNNPDSLTLENQQKIADALVALDYQENKVGRILASGRTEFVGVIIPNLYMHYYSEMLNQLLATYETYGYKFLVFAGNSKKDVEEQYLKELLAYNIEGLIMLSPTIPSKELASYQIPIVGIEREDEEICSVNTDNYMGGVQATSLLQKSDCDLVIHINADVPETTPAHGRIRGFLDICREFELPQRSRRFLRGKPKTSDGHLEFSGTGVSSKEKRYFHAQRYPRQRPAESFVSALWLPTGYLPHHWL